MGEFGPLMETGLDWQDWLTGWSVMHDSGDV